jgi:hypothetical protein
MKKKKDYEDIDKSDLVQCLEEYDTEQEKKCVSKLTTSNNGPEFLNFKFFCKTKVG